MKHKSLETEVVQLRQRARLIYTKRLQHQGAGTPDARKREQRGEGTRGNSQELAPEDLSLSMHPGKQGLEVEQEGVHSPHHSDSPPLRPGGAGDLDEGADLGPPDPGAQHTAISQLTPLPPPPSPPEKMDGPPYAPSAPPSTPAAHRGLDAKGFAGGESAASPTGRGDAQDALFLDRIAVRLREQRSHSLSPEGAPPPYHAWHGSNVSPMPSLVMTAAGEGQRSVRFERVAGQEDRGDALPVASSAGAGEASVSGSCARLGDSGSTARAVGFGLGAGGANHSDDNLQPYSCDTPWHPPRHGGETLSAAEAETSLCAALQRLSETDELLEDMKVAKDEALGASRRAQRWARSIEMDYMNVLPQMALLQAAKDALQKENETLKTEIQVATDEHSRQSSALSSCVQSLQQQLSLVVEASGDEQAVMGSMRMLRDLSAQRDKTDSAERELHAARARVRVLEQEVQTLRKDRDDTRGRLDAAMSDIAAHSEQATDQILNLQKFEQRLSEACSKVKNSEDEARRLLKRAESAEQSLHEAENTIARLRAEALQQLPPSQTGPPVTPFALHRHVAAFFEKEAPAEVASSADDELPAPTTNFEYDSE
eukprot:CAMPEP_0206212756 /NCGR_PEP_ID=MMETSP0047_2-20121206/744_1 /ASSEMBLY_ACC=CAM_ASM_000192 /TAXON_ID=195065 /ORGANISM="Chroomonas mesostigmatica_cf, Strain CCMP1168" /LENGTH=597 /DNA_ID=CAMNT_0053634831 /DNA_START=121 /DNA_END=1914 /DNA_ORIENTATION=-